MREPGSAGIIRALSQGMELWERKRGIGELKEELVKERRGMNGEEEKKSSGRGAAGDGRRKRVE